MQTCVCAWLSFESKHTVGRSTATHRGGTMVGIEKEISGKEADAVPAVDSYYFFFFSRSQFTPSVRSAR